MVKNSFIYLFLSTFEEKTNCLCLLKVVATECGGRSKEDMNIYPLHILQSVFSNDQKHRFLTRLPLTEYAWWWSAPARIIRRLDSQWLFGYRCFQQLIQKLPFNTVHTNATSKSLKGIPSNFSTQTCCFPSNPKFILSTTHLDTPEPRKNTFYFPLYWLLNRNLYIGLL